MTPAAGPARAQGDQESATTLRLSTSGVTAWRELPPLVVAHFARRQRWSVGASRVHACAGVARSRCEQASTWAATVRWRDCPDCVPPHRTLATLPPSGIAIVLMQGRESKRVPSRTFPWPTQIRASKVVGPIEGEPERFGVFEQFGQRHGVELSLWVFFGRRRPSRAQLARVNGELHTASPMQ